MRRRIVLRQELAFVKAQVAVRGIDIAVRYLRNPNPRITPELLRAYGATVGRRSRFKRSVLLDNVYEDLDSTGDFSRLCIGVNCYVGDDIYLDLANRILIGDDVVISGRASFVTHADCNRSPYLNALFPRKTAPIVVERGAWVGFGATVLSGVRIGAESVVGAGALVTKDVSNRTLVLGIPAVERSHLF